MTSPPRSQPGNEYTALPCPFCGTKPVVAAAGFATIHCASIDCFGPRTTAQYLTDALKQWNARVPHQSCGVQTADDTRCLEDMTLAYNARKAAIEECARCLEALGARYHSGRDLIAHIRAALSLPEKAEGREDLAPSAWLVDGPLPLDSSEVFLTHAKAVEAFNDWGKRITPLYAIPSSPLSSAESK